MHLASKTPASTRFSSYLTNHSFSGSSAGCSSPKTVTVTESLVQFMDHYPSLPRLPNWLISSRSNAKYYSLQWWLAEYKPPAIPLPLNSIIISLPAIWHLYLGIWLASHPILNPLLAFQSLSNCCLPIPVNSRFSQPVAQPASHPKLIHQEIILATPSKSDYLTSITMSPNLHHLCLNYSNSLTCGLTVSTFVIYNLFSIQEPDKLLNENQA